MGEVQGQDQDKGQGQGPDSGPGRVPGLCLAPGLTSDPALVTENRRKLHVAVRRPMSTLKLDGLTRALICQLCFPIAFLVFPGGS